MTPNQVVQAYERGDLTLTTLIHEFGRCLTEGNTTGLVSLFSPELLGLLKAEIDEYPRNEEGWSLMRIYYIASVPTPRDVAPEQLEAEQLKEGRIFRRGVEILRDCIGPSPSGRIEIDPYLLAWADGTILKLARAIRDEQAFEQMPILADALEEAGCLDREILRHLHSRGPHYRCCWCLCGILGDVESEPPRSV